MRIHTQREQKVNTHAQINVYFTVILFVRQKHVPKFTHKVFQKTSSDGCIKVLHINESTWNTSSYQTCKVSLSCG